MAGGVSTRERGSTVAIARSPEMEAEARAATPDLGNNVRQMLHKDTGTACLPETPQKDGLLALLRRMAEALVNHPEQISLTSIDDGDRTTLRLQVAPEDVGKLIGTGGRTARSLRIVLTAAATKQRRTVSLDIVQSESAR